MQTIRGRLSTEKRRAELGQQAEKMFSQVNEEKNAEGGQFCAYICEARRFRRENSF